ncbi:MAG: hypothetical protein WBE01_09270 [Methyloceanibacter sp.]
MQYDLVDEGPQNRCGFGSDVGFRVEGFLKPFELSAEKLLKVGRRRHEHNLAAGCGNGFLELNLLTFEAE